MAKAIHWDLSGKCGFERDERWYDHVPEFAFENDRQQTSMTFQCANRPRNWKSLNKNGHNQFF